MISYEDFVSLTHVSFFISILFLLFLLLVPGGNISLSASYTLQKYKYAIFFARFNLSSVMYDSSSITDTTYFNL